MQVIFKKGTYEGFNCIIMMMRGRRMAMMMKTKLNQLNLFKIKKRPLHLWFH